MTEYKAKEGTPICCNPNTNCDYRTYAKDICTSEGGPRNCGACMGACC